MGIENEASWERGKLEVGEWVRFHIRVTVLQTSSKQILHKSSLGYSSKCRRE